MAIVIQSATFGDERSNTDITKALQERIKKEGKVDVPVNSSLVPVFGQGGAVKLDDTEIADAKQQAEEACGGPGDQVCLEIKQQEFQAQRLSEKRMENNKVENIIKGRRLRVKYREGNEVKIAEIPEGQDFTVATLSQSKDAPAAPPFKLETPSLSVSPGEIVLKILGWLGIVAATFFYAFSILVTYVSFNKSGYGWLKYVATAAAVLIPYSGYAITFVFFGIDEFVKNIPTADKLSSTT